MRAALEAGAAPVPAPRQLRAGTALAAPIAVLLGWSVLDGGGADPSGLFLLGTAAIVLLAGALVCVLAGLLPAPRPGRAGTVLAGAFACWVVWLGVSILWSIEADRSWDALNRGLVYAALLGLGMLGGALLPRAPQLLAGCLALLCALAIGWALAGKVVPALGPDVARSARLRDPVGYWNALALLVAMSLPLWLWLAARRGHAASLRALAAAAVVPAGVALLLTASRGGLVVAIVAVLVWLALSPARLEGLVALLLAVPVVGAIGAWALTRSALTSEGSAVAGRERAGLELGLVLVAGTALVLALAFAAAKAEEREPVTPQRRRRLLRATAALAGGAVVLSLAVAALSVDDPLGWVRARADEFRNPPSADVTQGAGRITTFSSNHRWTWWNEAARIFVEHPLVGTGAGTFELARRPLREDTQQPIAPHDLGLQALSETGLVGFALVLAVVLAALGVVSGALRRLDGAQRAAAVPLAAAAAAYLAHSLVDMGWEYVAVSAPTLVSLGVLASSGRVPRRDGPRRPLAALALAALALAAVSSLASPWLAERRLDGSLDALAAGDTARAARAAQRARALNPLSIRPLHREAIAAEAAGRLDRAESLYVRAAELQPENPETWYELGRFRYESRGDLDGAYVDLNRAYSLDNFHPRAGPLLDAIRKAFAARIR